MFLSMTSPDEARKWSFDMENESNGKQTDIELQAMNRVVKTLTSLPSDARRRVVDYIASRFAAPSEMAPQPLEDEPGMVF